MAFIPIWLLPYGVSQAHRRGCLLLTGMSVIHAKEVENSNSDGWPFKTWVTHESHTYPIPIGSFVNAEVNWSPDSTAFFVTYSDTGAVGQYHLLVYRLDKDEIHST